MTRASILVASIPPETDARTRGRPGCASQVGRHRGGADATAHPTSTDISTPFVGEIRDVRRARREAAVAKPPAPADRAD
jgi:hypothetical protein